MPANGQLNVDVQTVEDFHMSSGSESAGLSEEDEEFAHQADINKFGGMKMDKMKSDTDGNSDVRYQSQTNRTHEKFLRECIEELLEKAIFSGTDRSSRVLEWRNPEDLASTLDLDLSTDGVTDSQLLDHIRQTIKYSVKTGHPYFVNQLFSTVDPYALAGQWVTDALNPSVYTYEVAPVFTLMEEVVLRELRKIVGFPNGDGDGIFAPGGSIANGYAISCARYKCMPDVKAKGLHAMPRLVLFTSEDAHYSIQKLASFMGIGANNVYSIRTDACGKMQMDHLESEILRSKCEGGHPFMVSATAGTTVLGAFDPLTQIADLCEKYQLWFHVDAAWGGGALVSPKYRTLLAGIERADSVTWNPHKLLAAPQQCSTFLTRHTNLLKQCHSCNASYLFQKDKFYDTKYDTGDKHIQCGRRADVFKFWLMWKAKGTMGLQKHTEKVFEMAEYFTEQIRQRSDFEMVVNEPECTNVCFWYLPPSLRDCPRDEVFWAKLHKVAPKIKERMMKDGSMMITYQPLRQKPNFFRLVLQNSSLEKSDMLHIINKIAQLGEDL
ncbi:cysteine sulfinic acid decarboxylase [Phlebotomus papatasi]|uniref:cysteine sulfinic acid decarboxylase n=1 Tax=Phlebotomus papatasi TaxID=29031 RepID=UPI002483B7FC|nr:cysteine sulfinic acid decarboxylase [Phlebotomus papatasi]